MQRSSPKLVYFVTVDWFFCSHFIDRAVAAREAGYEVVVVTHVDRHRDLITNVGLRLLPLQVSRSSLNPLQAIAALLQLIRIYKIERPDLIHHVALKPILLGGLAARMVGIHAVVNAVVGGGYAFTSRRLLARLLRPLVTLALRLVLNPSGSKVVFENTDDASSFCGACLVRPADAVLIRGAGVDPSGFIPRQNFEGPQLVMLVARLLWDKGIGEFVDAARLLRERGVAARFVLVGDPDPDNRASIDASTLNAWRAEGTVELWGFRSDIPQVLSEATIACLPSYREGLPKSLLEAMAVGLPCVTTDVPGCREAVRDSDNGFLVPAQDAHALADALQRLIASPALARRMGRRGRARLEQEFSTQLVNESTLALYQTMLAS
jgi:glycosyltransferase involved in cell wall biosynthesis